MSSITPVTKDEDRQGPVPTVWRGTLSDIVARFAQGDFSLAIEVAGVDPIDARNAEAIAGNIAAYGGTLIELPDAAWETSVCFRRDEGWHLLVDLFLADGPSDLVLDVRVREGADRPENYRFEVYLVYVP